MDNQKASAIAKLDEWKNDMSLLDSAVQVISLLSNSIEHFSLTDNLLKLNVIPSKYFLKHDELLQKEEYCDEVQLNLYYNQILLKCSGPMNLIRLRLREYSNQVINLNSIQALEYVPGIEGQLQTLVSVFTELIAEVDKVSINIPAAGPESFDFQVSVNRDPTAQASFEEYLKVGRFTDLNSPEFIDISNCIKNIYGSFYKNPIDLNAAIARPFAAIVGPSFMGKSQFSFSLAQKFSVIYVNFSNSENAQLIYSNFLGISGLFKSMLKSDFETLTRLHIKTESEDVAHNGFRVRLRTVGLLWLLFEDHLQYDRNRSEWFKYYLRSEPKKFVEMSIAEYMIKLNSKLDSLNRQEFVPPIVYIDEFSRDLVDQIKLLRSLSRILVLPCFLASTNAKVTNLLNWDSASAIRVGAVTVYAISKLPKANNEAIMNVIGWSDYWTGGGLDVDRLLLDLKIQSDANNLNRLKNLTSLMISQSSTCLQGVSLIVFKLLKTELLKQEQLDAMKIWDVLVTGLFKEIACRKPRAFTPIGSFRSLQMLSFNQDACSSLTREGMRLSDNTTVSKINEHYYFFGNVDKNIIPLNNCKDGLNTEIGSYHLRSFFKKFHENPLFCIALWSNICGGNLVSAAALIRNHAYETSTSYSSSQTPKNDSESQECMVHWSLCKSTFQNYSRLTGGLDFLESFIFNIQIDNDTSITIDNLPGLSSFNMNFSKKLTNFMKQIKVPYLLPGRIVSDEICEKLEGLCPIGFCDRLEDFQRMDMSFDLIFGGVSKKGYVECKYINENLRSETVLSYLHRALFPSSSKRTRLPPSIFAMLVTFSIPDFARSAEAWNTFFIDEHDEGLHDVAIYSVFYDNETKTKLSITTLVEPIAINKVFIIVQTNFVAPRI